MLIYNKNKKNQLNVWNLTQNLRIATNFGQQESEIANFGQQRLQTSGIKLSQQKKPAL